MSNILTFQDISVNYEKSSVLWEISFAIPKGKLVGIVGPNGAGKSTLLKAALGLVKPISGKVEFFGKPLSAVRQRVAYIPQRGDIDWDFPITVFDVALMGRYGKLGLIKWVSKQDRVETTKVLEKLNLMHLAKRQISQLSGGQQQRLFIARALLQQAEIYLLDEPFAGVDLVTEKMIVELLQNLVKEGKTILMVHHDLNTVEKYFDTVALLNTSLIAYGDVGTVYTKESLGRTYGNRSAVFEEVSKLSQDKASGIT